MRRIIILLLLIMLPAALFAGCGKSDNESGDGKNTPTPKPTGEAADSGQNGDVAGGEPIDMEAFLSGIAAANPDADPDVIIGEILKSPYFALFVADQLHHDWGNYYPGMTDDRAFLGKGKDACVCDLAGGTGALVYVFAPQKPEDAQGIADALKANADPLWMDDEEKGKLDGQTCLVIDGKVYFAMYNTKMKAVTGTVAGKARDLVGIFHEYLADDANASCISIAEYLVGHQKFNEVHTAAVSEGTLTGFGDMENAVSITGFTDGAAILPMISPNLFICYIFRVSDAKAADGFAGMLRDKANLNWNVCMTADTIITETDGNAVLFIMCSENDS